MHSDMFVIMTCDQSADLFISDVILQRHEIGCGLRSRRHINCYFLCTFRSTLF